MDSILSLKNISKAYRTHWLYKKRVALELVSFDLLRGETLALLGVNGAGKTTTIKCILGLVQYQAGEILLDQKPLSSYKQRASFGFLPEQPYFYQHLNVEETLLFYGNMLGLRGKNNQEEVNRTLNRVGLSSRKRDKIKSLSKGLQQRLAIAQAILNNPRILILDEPFSGLDPLARREMKELFLEIKESGTSILVSSHILHDIEQLATRAVFLRNGRIVKERHLSDLEIQLESLEETFIKLSLNEKNEE